MIVRDKDGTVIAEYVDTESGPGIITPEPLTKITMSVEQALNFIDNIAMFSDRTTLPS